MIEPKRIDEIYTEMDTYILELERDPSALGPQYFQEKIATCRNYLNRVSLVVSELNREKLGLTSDLRSLEATYALEYDRLLSQDEHVKRLASIDDRKSTVGHMLRKEKVEINDLSAQIHALDAISKLVNHRNRELHATMNAIKDQRRLVQIEVQTGAFYGDERKQGFSTPMGPIAVDEINAEELDALISGGDLEPTAAPEPQAVMAETPVEATSPPEPQAVVSASKVQPQDDEALVARFLDGPPVAAAKPSVEPSKSEEEDLFSFLDSV
jgi:hypothetical protein